MSVVREPVVAAYDAIADVYDSQVADDSWMRSVLWRHFEQTFKVGDRILDCGCGTGLDAQFLARLGAHVTAIDVSPAMVERTSLRKTNEAAGTIHAEVLDIAHLAARFPEAEFDGIISCFGGLNTQPSLSAFADDAARLLKPGGRIIIHLLNAWSLWEWTGFVSRGKWHSARTLGEDPCRDFVIGGVTVKHYLGHPNDIYAHRFQERFQIRQMYALGVLRPPARGPSLPISLLEILERGDGLIGRWPPFRHWGRFAVMELEKR